MCLKVCILRRSVKPAIIQSYALNIFMEKKLGNWHMRFKISSNARSKPKIKLLGNYFKKQEGSIFRYEATLSDLQLRNRKFEHLQMAHNTGNLFFMLGVLYCRRHMLFIKKKKILI